METKQAVASLIAICTEIAGTVNNDHSNFLGQQGSLGAIQERVGALIESVKTIQEYLDSSRGAIDQRFRVVEDACTETAKSLASQLKAQCQEFYEALAGFQAV
jgi:prophage DNA circulation protein